MGVKITEAATLSATKVTRPVPFSKEDLGWLGKEKLVVLMGGARETELVVEGRHCLAEFLPGLGVDVTAEITGIPMEQVELEKSDSGKWMRQQLAQLLASFPGRVLTSSSPARVSVHIRRDDGGAEKQKLAKALDGMGLDYLSSELTGKPLELTAVAKAMAKRERPPVAAAALVPA